MLHHVLSARGWKLFGARDRATSPAPGALRRFKNDERGTLIVFGLMLLLAMMMAAGLAVDVMRVEATRTQIQNTLDRAVLAATSLNQTGTEAETKAVVKDYFAKASLSQYLDEDSIDVEQTSAGSDISYRRVYASATADVQSLLLQLVGVESMTTGGGSIAEEGIGRLEIALVVDVSGSMGWSSSTGNSKIYELRNAAKDFAYMLQCNPTGDRLANDPCTVKANTVSITLVPYSEQVLLGERLGTELNLSEEGDAESTCVTFAPDDFESVALDPEDELTRENILTEWPSYVNYSNSTNCFYEEDWRTVRPYINSYSTIEPHLSALSANGGTSVDLGAKWGAAFLDPMFNTLLLSLTVPNDMDGDTNITGQEQALVTTAFNDRPYAYSDTGTIKALVLMTDGVNDWQRYVKEGFKAGPSDVYRNHDPDRNQTFYSIHNPGRQGGSYYWLRDDSWHYEPDLQKGIYERQCYYDRRGRRRCNDVLVGWEDNTPENAYEMDFQEVWERKGYEWYADFYWTEEPLAAYDNPTKNEHTQDICNAARTAGIITYTVGFEVTSGEDVLRDCAFVTDYYYPSTGDTLTEDFRSIATSINKLRLTQ